MNHFDDLPNRHKNHTIEDQAITAFQVRLGESRAFILQAADRKDYGVDCQIEVSVNGCATNARVHVQLKGTERPLNANGSLSVPVQRTNLNYLLMQPYSFYVAYHVPTRSLRICTAESVARQYAHSGTNWTEQESLTASFVDELTVERLCRLAGLASAAARSSRDHRIREVRGAVSDIHVPDDPVLARKLLVQLYGQDADDVISAGFAKFEAAFGVSSDEMDICYMSEINLGMEGASRHPERIEEAIGFFRARLVNDHYHVGNLHYTIGNAFHALHNEEAAKCAFEAALADPGLAAAPDLAAQIHKNLGSSYALLGDQKLAVDHCRKALQLDPELAEAHTALGIHFVRLGGYEEALHHLDQVIFSNQMQGRTSEVSGWRANVLFNLGRGREAFREVNGLVTQADRFLWIWPWCRSLVAAFGRSSVHNAQQALPFWQRYVRAHPEDPIARYELLMSTFYLRGQGESVGKLYSVFRQEFGQHISHIDADNAALPWDRLGHWAQEDEDWAEAERCFRKAHELGGGEYGYCLAIALKQLERFDESVPLLLEQAETVQPDAMSWFQLAAAYASLSRWPAAVDAYEKALALDPDHDLARFDLGGAHWNSGDPAKAAEVWASAIARFPDHELTAKLQHDLPSLFGDPCAGQGGDDGAH